MVQHTNQYHIREATIKDLKYTNDIARVVNEAYQTGDSWTKAKDEFEFNVPRTNSDEIKAMIEENAGTTHIFILAMDDDNKVVGTLLAKFPDDQGEVEFTLLSVAPEHQSRGIGNQLMQYMFDRVKRIGATVVVLDLLDNRTDLVAWYKKLGFLEGEKVEFNWRGHTLPGVSSLFMRKSLV